MTRGPRRCGPKTPPPWGGLDRADYVALLPEAKFEQWAAERLAAAAGNKAEERRVRQEIETDRKIRAWARQEGRRIRDEQQAHLEAPQASELSESVLEERMLQAFVATSHFTRVRVPAGVVVAHGPLGLLLQQLHVSTATRAYRLDFALVDPGADLFLCVEVDGAAWHERTPEQGQRDRERDRKLTAAGWTVLRFLGREVFRNASACVHEVIAIAVKERRKVGT